MGENLANRRYYNNNRLFIEEVPNDQLNNRQSLTNRQPLPAIRDSMGSSLSNFSNSNDIQQMALAIPPRSSNFT